MAAGGFAAQARGGNSTARKSDSCRKVEAQWSVRADIIQ
jgi:hypothetical protein